MIDGVNWFEDDWRLIGLMQDMRDHTLSLKGRPVLPPLCRGWWRWGVVTFPSDMPVAVKQNFPVDD